MKYKHTLLPGILAIIVLSIVPGDLKAETPAEKGLKIAKEMDNRDLGFGDNTVDMVMTLKNRHGEESTRYMHSKTLEVKDDGDKSISVFNRPKDIKGTAMLTFTHKTGPDDQWLYMPALKRVKRITSSKKSGSFMGSEFANEDLASQEVEKYTYRFIKEENIGGTNNIVMERYPVDKHSGYSKQIVWIDLPEYRIMKVDYYDRKKTLLKTLTFHNYQQFFDQYWRPGELRMINHQTKKSTKLAFTNYKFRTGLKNKDFKKNSLKRAK